MKISEIFIEMLQYPNSPKIYRNIRNFYRQIGKEHEAKAFAKLLEERYKELDDNDGDFDQESGHRQDRRERP